MQDKSGGVSRALSKVYQEAVFINIPLELFMDASLSKELRMGSSVESSLSLERTALETKQWTF